MKQSARNSLFAAGYICAFLSNGNIAHMAVEYHQGAERIVVQIWDDVSRRVIRTGYFAFVDDALSWIGQRASIWEFFHFWKADGDTLTFTYPEYDNYNALMLLSADDYITHTRQIASSAMYVLDLLHKPVEVFDLYHNMDYWSDDEESQKVRTDLGYTLNTPDGKNVLRFDYVSNV